MKRYEYLKKAIELKLHQESRWWFSAFAITQPANESWKEDPYEGRVVYQDWGHEVIFNGEAIKITDAEKDRPLFIMKDPITVDPTWLPNIKEPTETTVGSLMVNCVLIADIFGAKIPFMPKKITASAIEQVMILNRADPIPGKPNDPTKFYIEERHKFGIACEFVRTLATLSTYSLTDKNMVKPEGIDEHKATLLKEKYNNDLSDPVRLAEFEAEMLKWASEKLKDDPSFGKLVKGKILGNSIRKMFISSGAEGGMGGKMVAVTESLADGITYSPEVLQAIVNGARSGSYFRGLDTVKGGVSFKLAVRVLSSFYIQDEDCGTKLGMMIKYEENNISQLVQRTEMLHVGEKYIETIEEARKYIGKTITVRSPGYCKSKSSTFCKACGGPRLTRFAEGLAIPASNVTAIILAASMAAMHKNTTEVTNLELDKISS